MSDKVNHPEHYCSGEIEVIDIIKSVLGSMDLKPFESYVLGNVLKYLSRYKNKNGLEDLKKAEWYLNKLISVDREEL